MSPIRAVIAFALGLLADFRAFIVAAIQDALMSLVVIAKAAALRLVVCRVAVCHPHPSSKMGTKKARPSGPIGALMTDAHGVIVFDYGNKKELSHYELTSA